LSKLAVGPNAGAGKMGNRKIKARKIQVHRRKYPDIRVFVKNKSLFPVEAALVKLI
jgi:hypothetical protein